MKYLAFASLVATATATTTTCADYHLDFEGPERGEYVTDYWKDTLGVEIVCHANNAGDDGRCRILDSSNPVGNWSDADVTRVGGSGSSLCAGNTAAGDCGDPDLGSPNNQCPGGKSTRFSFLRLGDNASNEMKMCLVLYRWPWCQ